MGWVDTHCHLQLVDADPATLIDRAAEVDWMVVPGVDADSSSEARELARMRPDRLVYSAGLHPHSASDWPKESERIQALLDDAVAVGETGLDFYRMLAAEDDQIAAFEAQIELARELDKPVIVHCRDAFEKVYELLESHAVGERAVLHCWTGGRRWTRRFLELGVVFSFAGPLAFETGETIRLAAELVPPDRAMAETDTPYLAPPPHRGRPNEPAFVRFTGQMLAKVWEMDPEEVARSTSDTARRVFGGPA